MREMTEFTFSHRVYALFTYHIRAHLCPRPKNQFTLFIDVVYAPRQLLGEAVWPRDWLIQQTLTIPGAVKENNTNTNDLLMNEHF